MQPTQSREESLLAVVWRELLPAGFVCSSSDLPLRVCASPAHVVCPLLVSVHAFAGHFIAFEHLMVCPAVASPRKLLVAP